MNTELSLAVLGVSALNLILMFFVSESKRVRNALGPFAAYIPYILCGITVISVLFCVIQSL